MMSGIRSMTRGVRVKAWVVAGVFSVGLGLAPHGARAASIDELVAASKKEGPPSVTVTSSMPGRTAADLKAAFEKQFGIEGVTVSTVSETKHYPKAAAATKAGAVPTYDAIEGSGKNNIQLMGLGGVQKIDGWQALLREINSDVREGRVSPETISPEAFAGYAFQWIFRLKALLYNPKLITKEDLPKTHADLADPKYRGRWSQPPFAAHWDIGPLAFPEIPKDEWIAIVRKAGENAGAVLSERAGVERVVLGEFAFTPANLTYYLAIKAKDPEAPLRVAYFKDYNPIVGSYYIVRKGTRHPAGGALFALWMGTPEAKAIWQPATFRTQFPWGQTDLDREVRDGLKESDAKMLGFFDSQKGIDFLEWMGTPEGRAYRKAVSRAIRGK